MTHITTNIILFHYYVIYSELKGLINISGIMVKCSIQFG